MAVLLAAFTWCSYSRKCFKLQLDAPFHTLCKLILPSKQSKEPGKDTESPVLAVEQDEEVDMVSDVPKLKEDDIVSGIPVVLKENKRVIVPVVADSTQEEALILLKKLKIIEHDTTAGELCTRREYARWLVKINSLLERNPKYRIGPLRSLDSSVALAFDDVSINDPDFWCIQALGEAGIVLSKLSAGSFGSFSDASKIDDQGKFEFRPDSFITRFDLVNWKALLEYSCTSKIDDKMLRKKEGFLDLDAIVRNASPQLLTDLMAGDRSITRRVFGNTRFLQPHKPITKAQAAVALTSGRLAEAIHSELSRLEAEKLARFVEMEEIRSELIRRGDIQRYWEEKLSKEKDHVLLAERDLDAVLLDLEKEKRSRDASIDVYTKAKAALDCQQQLLFRLREEVGGMNDRIISERTNLVNEQQGLEKLSASLCEKQDAILEAKSILEAEKEALQILRSWLEEEAQRIHVRANYLEQATRRWTWNGESVANQSWSPGSKESQTEEESSHS